MFGKEATLAWYECGHGNVVLLREEERIVPEGCFGTKVDTVNLSPIECPFTGLEALRAEALEWLNNKPFFSDDHSTNHKAKEMNLGRCQSCHELDRSAPELPFTEPIFGKRS